MCYLIRHQQQAEAEPGGVAQQPRGFESVRPRWVGAAALTLLGSLAVAAALVSTPSMAPQLQQGAQQAGGAPLPVAAQGTSLPPGGGTVEQTALPMDDGVPSGGTEIVKAGAGGCHHGL